MEEHQSLATDRESGTQPPFSQKAQSYHRLGPSGFGPPSLAPSVPDWHGPLPSTGNGDIDPFSSVSSMHSFPLTNFNAGADPTESHSITFASNGRDDTKLVCSTRSTSFSDRSGSKSPKSRFSTDLTFRGSHFVKVANVELNKLAEVMSELSRQHGWNFNMPAPFEGIGRPNDYVMYFDDLRDAAKAVQCLMRSANIAWKPTFISLADYDGCFARLSPFLSKDAFYDAQVIFTVGYEKPFRHDKSIGLDSDFRNCITSIGDVCTFKEEREWNSLEWCFHVEFYKVSDAHKALSWSTRDEPVIMNDVFQILGNRVGEKGVINVQAPPTAANNAHRIEIPAGVTFVISPLTPMPTSTRPSNGIIYSPTGRTAWYVDSNGKQILASSPTLGPQKMMTITPPHHVQPTVNSRLTQTPNSSGSQMQPWGEGYTLMPSPLKLYDGIASLSGEHGQDVKQQQNSRVIPALIHSGQDVRTTIMLRNLPQKWGARDVKYRLDLTSRGRYDFSYVRMDFSKGTNVGYAFVNFETADDIIPFYEAFVDKNWEAGSQRICQISYATTQGYQCLTAKFRNSAVMDEYEDYKPKVWWTQVTAPEPHLVGQERPFPLPDNFSKKQRSRDNAAHVGLYSPGNGWRSGDRGRRSQYDRGTTAQIHEDALYSRSNNLSGNLAMYANSPQITPQASGRHLLAFGGPYNSPFAAMMGTPPQMAHGTSPFSPPLTAYAGTLPPATPRPMPLNGGLSASSSRHDLTPFTSAGPVQTPQVNNYGYVGMPRSIVEDRADGLAANPFITQLQHHYSDNRFGPHH